VEDIRTRLARLDCCAISDALDTQGLSASVTGLVCQTSRRRICGQVITVRLAKGKPPEGAPVRHLCTTAIEQAEAGNVIVVEQRTGVEAAGWGGILSTAAKVKGVDGVIMEGLARDIDEAEQLGFTVYARGATARTARGRIHEAETGGAIQVGDTTVNNGDWVVADSSGTAFIPNEKVEAVTAAAERIVAKEAAMAKSVLSGTRATEAMGANYEHLLEKTGD
jgi:regulator of RNase E activity RraA